MRYFVTVVGDRGSPLPAKLGIKDGTTLAQLKAPPGLLTELPPGVTVKRQARGTADVVVAFFTRRAEFEGRMARSGR